MMNTPTAPLHPAEAQILAKLPELVRNQLRQLRMMVFDVDGVLTDGRLWYSANGEEFKSFHALDGHGLRMLGESGIGVALITGRESGIVSRRAAELGIPFVHQGVPGRPGWHHSTHAPRRGRQAVWPPSWRSG